MWLLDRFIFCRCRGAAGRADRGAGDPPPPGSNPPSDHCKNNNYPRQSQRQRRIQELQYVRPIKFKELKLFAGKPGDDFDTWCISKMSIGPEATPKPARYSGRPHQCF